MLRSFVPVCLVFMFAAVFLPAQDEIDDSEKPESDFLFPIHILLRDAESGRVSWSPDWPANIPVDAFDVFNSGNYNVSAVTLSGGGYVLNARLDSGGASAFPVYLNGVFYQVTTEFDSEEKVAGFTVEGESPIQIEFLAFDNVDGEPSLARIHEGESWFFASIAYRSGLTLETWRDVDGNIIAVFTARTSGRTDSGGTPQFYKSVIQHRQEEAADTENAVFKDDGGKSAGISGGESEISSSSEYFDFDSMGNMTRIRKDDSIFEALYTGGGPRYWKQSGFGNFALQWDGQGRLVRMTGFSFDGGDADEEALDYRYEYTFDERGAWTERREIRMSPELGVLAPSAGDSFQRIIEYR
ncbi:MAG: hypothetical protein LBB22_04990 [Treponema sp.]|jgi:hypothetical protein|nr:hypothetical protein [Treponema sp.]